MKGLQKYYAVKADLHWPQNAACTHICVPVYRADEADAVFAEEIAEMRRERDGACVRIMVLEQQAENDHHLIAQQSHGFAYAIREREERHAEEIERLTAKLSRLPADWDQDSSLETWFPLTAQELVRLRERVAYLESRHIDGAELRKQAERYVELQVAAMRVLQRLIQLGLVLDGANHDGMVIALGVAEREIERLHLQAERYEKLRRLDSMQICDLFHRSLRGDGRFDELVDQLPASGEASAPRKGSYGQECNRTACHQSPATWHNRETLRYYCEPCGKLINHNNRSLNPPLCAPTCSTCTKPLREIRTDPWGPVIGHRFCDCAASPDEQAGRVE